MRKRLINQGDDGDGERNGWISLSHRQRDMEGGRQAI